MPGPRPALSRARAPLTREVTVVAHDGTRRRLSLAAERPLTLYVDRQEVVTLMTLGQEPELLALGYLLNQGLVREAAEVASITVDWEVGAAAVRTVHGVSGLAERLARRTVTTGCGQGTVFGDWLERVAPLPALGVAGADAPGDGTGACEGSVDGGDRGEGGENSAAARSNPHAALVDLLDRMRSLPSVHREAGSVHGTALWRAPRGEAPPSMLVHIEDVGRHNAVDTVAGWMAMQRVDGAACWLYTTGRLTSEMVLKAAHLRIPVVVSRNGATAMGQQLAEQLRLTLIGRANGQRYLCYAGAERLAGLPQAAPAAP